MAILSAVSTASEPPPAKKTRSSPAAGPPGATCGQPLGEFESDGMAHLEGGGIVELFQLPRHGFGDLAAAVTGIDAPEACRTIQDLVSVDIAVIHALGAFEQARRLLELPVRRERHPEIFQISCIGGGGHGHSPLAMMAALAAVRLI